jgi:NAD(P)-dependent dehydrogenase (short-subunit alcohol dehydrogenase family)
MEPEGKIALVTGAAGGIGGALVRELLARGAARVVATDINGEGVEALAGDLDGAVPRTLDVSDEQATVALIDSIEAELGPVDLFFANAGVATGGGPEAGDDVWNLQWQVNVMSHVYASRALFPRWTERGAGHLITTASMAGLLSSLGDGVYSTTKHAALGLAEWLAVTYADKGIHVSCICPGAVDTAMLRAGGGGDAGKASAVIGGGDVLAPGAAAVRILDQLAEDRFLILTHPEMREFVVGKAENPERWIRGMTRLWQRALALLRT